MVRLRSECCHDTDGGHKVSSDNNTSLNDLLRQMAEFHFFKLLFGTVNIKTYVTLKMGQVMNVGQLVE